MCVGVCRKSARSDVIASVLGPLGVLEWVRRGVLVEADQIGEGALERGVQVGVVRSQVLDCSHALHSFQLPQGHARDEVETQLANAETSVPEQIGNINCRDPVEVGDHVLDPERCQRSKNDLETMRLAQKVEHEAGAPETQVNGGGLLKSEQAVVEPR